ncbi:unnamed protein product [Orchesella dallaii]|uniref:C2H2-type domain-containing protein n=1 Tax=Orchesella dallaii TaxID=48710 RepID=A0ABP1R2C6_9HEXA
MGNNHNIHCLFCAALISSPKSLHKKGINLQTEVFITPDIFGSDWDNDDDAFEEERKEPNPTLLQFYGELPNIQENLNIFFILQKILKIPQKTLCKLVEQDELFKSSSFIDVCESCGKSVQSFYETIKQVCKLERRLSKLECELKGKIRESEFCNEEGSPAWRQIRNEILKNVDDDYKIMFEPLGEAATLTEHELPQPQPLHFLPRKESTSKFTNPQSKSTQCKLKRTKYTTVSNPNITQFFRGTQRYFQCRLCPAEACKFIRMREHLKLHEEGTPAIPCDECGWYLPPGSVYAHKGKRHGGSQSRKKSQNWRKIKYS